eukprot:gene10243-18932_t
MEHSRCDDCKQIKLEKGQRIYHKELLSKMWFYATEQNEVEENDELSISANIWDRLADILCADNITPFAEYVEIDKNEVGIIESLTDTEIVHLLSEEPSTEIESDEEDDETPTKEPTSAEAHESLNVLLCIEV